MAVPPASGGLAAPQLQGREADGRRPVLANLDRALSHKGDWPGQEPLGQLLEESPLYDDVPEGGTCHLARDQRPEVQEGEDDLQYVSIQLVHDGERQIVVRRADHLQPSRRGDRLAHSDLGVAGAGLRGLGGGLFRAF